MEEERNTNDTQGVANAVLGGIAFIILVPFAGIGLGVAFKAFMWASGAA